MSYSPRGRSLKRPVMSLSIRQRPVDFSSFSCIKVTENEAGCRLNKHLLRLQTPKSKKVSKHDLYLCCRCDMFRLNANIINSNNKKLREMMNQRTKTKQQGVNSRFPTLSRDNSTLVKQVTSYEDTAQWLCVAVPAFFPHCEGERC